MEIGFVIKRLRKERGLSQEELAKKITTRTTLASIENRNQTVSFHLLIKLLDRLNIRLEEFLFLLNEENYTIKMTLYRNVHSEFYLTGTTSNELQAELLQSYTDTKDFFYLSVYIQMQGILYRKEGITYVEDSKLKSYIETIKEYLNKITNWNHMELALFTNCLFFFDSEYILLSYNRVIKKMTAMKKLRLYQDDVLVFLLNGINVFFERDEDRLVEYLLSQLNEQLSLDTQLYERSLYQFYKAVLEARQGKKEAMLDAHQIINYLEFVGLYRKAENLKRDIKKYVGNNP
ncbi:helix-turn-helix domain-containing protein [Jeotgalibaca porci]|uniref:Rgg family transcriptional regulator n=1 Tax=Jeotgalibaca porci TaxID=1868793 RepID=UPI003F901F22